MFLRGKRATLDNYQGLLIAPCSQPKEKSILREHFPAVLPFRSIYILRGCSCSNGPHNAPNKAWHGVEVVDAACVLDVQPRLQKRLRGRDIERDQGHEHSPGKDKFLPWRTGISREGRVILCPIKELRACRQRREPSSR